VRLAVPHGHSTPQEAALAGLAAGLERVRASTIAREGAWVLFYVRFFRLVLNTNLLCPIDSGAITAEVDGDAIKVSYRLRTVRLCIMTTGMALAAVVVVLSVSLDVMTAAGIGVLAWLWLFGGNYAIAWVRFRGFVKRSVREGFEKASRIQPRGVTVTS
jgi:hypothetical protein